MMYEMRRRKLEPTLLLTQRIFNLPYHIRIAWEDSDIGILRNIEEDKVILRPISNHKRNIKEYFLEY